MVPLGGIFFNLFLESNFHAIFLCSLDKIILVATQKAICAIPHMWLALHYLDFNTEYLTIKFFSIDGAITNIYLIKQIFTLLYTKMFPKQKFFISIIIIFYKLYSNDVYAWELPLKRNKVIDSLQDKFSEKIRIILEISLTFHTVPKVYP